MPPEVVQTGMTQEQILQVLTSIDDIKLFLGFIMSMLFCYFVYRSYSTVMGWIKYIVNIKF